MEINSIEKCKNNELHEALCRLKEYEAYCDLLNGDLALYSQPSTLFEQMPQQLKEWINIFDGGLLFSITMFLMRDKEPDKHNCLIHFDDINDCVFKEQSGIHPSLVCFAMTNYGNYYCYVPSERSECVYEWDIEQSALILKWNSFAEWLNEQIDFAESLIQENILLPFKD